ncbi:alpha/beta hydrolase [Candidatus Poribacteria bacterium]|jgi:acetyl esterase|nr:alpha/beta hydrolase [Candidatus Poribacteria bacterium]MBT5537085.1 alpha/beta hydrolase [Candidatus Poribacteria bacterium]MBT7804551.1 alpha/beta hydrolase [Candidatus Poribacteria bacterium]
MSPSRPEPTRRDVRYGPRTRNTLDFWASPADGDSPLALYIHGGGFVGGSKDGIETSVLRELLGAGIAVAAMNYTFVTEERIPAAHHDGRRALQFLRANAGEWGIDKARVGSFGGSAGAQVCMYLGYHADMADPDAADPVERESTRLTCVATNGGQTSRDFTWWMEHLPGYDAPHVPPEMMFSIEPESELRALMQEVSALSLVSAGDPPICMSYGMRPDDPVPTDHAEAVGWQVHHVIFGIKLKERMDALGLESHVRYPGEHAGYASNVAFLVEKLTSA